jgi:hypothetical protein
MIERIWHGWTTPEDAGAYERLLRTEVLPGIDVEGFEGGRVLRRPSGGVGAAVDGDAEEVEFVTVLRFASLSGVREFAGEDHRRAHVPPAARELLARYDDHVRHYELRERVGADGAVETGAGSEAGSDGGSDADAGSAADAGPDA